MASGNISDQTAQRFLQVVGVYKSFGAFAALRDVSFDVGRGKFVVLLGPSGCGKTTLMRIIGGLEVQSAGEVYYDGREISSLPPSKRGFGFVFQSYALFPNLTIEDNIAYGLKSRKLKPARVRERVEELLEVVGLTEQGRKYPAQLSGGQQQRVALARALATSPNLLLLDEPLSALDARVRIRMRAELKKLQRRFDLTTVMVTHDQAEALALADQIVVMNQGLIEQVGTPADIYQNPATPFVADFIGTMNFIPGEMIDGGDIRLGDFKLRCEVAAGGYSGAVLVAIRAEELKVCSGPIDNGKMVPGIVEELDYGGSFCRALIRVSHLDGRALVADLPNQVVSDEGITVGGQVWIHVPGSLSVSSRAEVSGAVVGVRQPGQAIGAEPISAPPQQKLSGDEWLMRGLTLGFAVWLAVTLLLPVATVVIKSVQSADGAFVGWANYAKYLTSPALLEGLRNSLFVASLTTIITITMALPFAFALSRTCMPFKGLLRGIALLKLLTPALLPAIAIRYLLGKNGYFGWMLGDQSVFGPIGIVVGLVFYTFPHALLILTAAFALADARLHEAALSLGAGKLRILWTVILPGAKLGIASAVIVVFTLAITDFSVPKVTGGDYNVLATDIYIQIVGQQNFGMGATMAVILLIPAVVAFAVDLAVRRKQVATLTSESVPFQPRPNRFVDLAFLAFCGFICGLILLVLGVAVWASLLQYWPYNLKLTLSHYDFSKVAGNGFQGYFNSLKMSLWTAVVGTAVIFSGAYLVEKGRGLRTIRHIVHFLSVLPLAIPGLVLGLAYVFFLANENNPLNVLFGTMAILVISTVVHYYPVGHLVAVTSLKQMDSAFEAVSSSLSVPFYRSFWRVTVPVCLPSILDISMYLFVTAMTTTSAVIFLYSHNTIVATVTIINLEESGLTASALAMGVLIVLTSGAARVLHWLVTRQLLSRSQAWRHR